MLGFYFHFLFVRNGNFTIVTIGDCPSFLAFVTALWGSQVALVVKNLPASAGDIRGIGSVPGLGRPPGGGHGNPFQDSGLENPHGQRSLVGYKSIGSQSWTQLKQLNTHTQLSKPYDMPGRKYPFSLFCGPGLREKKIPIYFLFFTFVGRIHVWWPELCVSTSSSCWLAAWTSSQKATSQVWFTVVLYFGVITGLWNVGGVLSGSTTHSPTSTFARLNHISKLHLVSYASFVKASQGNLSLLSCKFVFYLVIPGRVWTRLLSFSVTQELILFHFAAITEYTHLLLEPRYLRLSLKSAMHYLRLWLCTCSLVSRMFPGMGPRSTCSCSIFIMIRKVVFLKWRGAAPNKKKKMFWCVYIRGRRKCCTWVPGHRLKLIFINTNWNAG